MQEQAYGGLSRRAKRILHQLAAELETLLGPADTAPESEDCLTVNVWTAARGRGAGGAGGERRGYSGEGPRARRPS